MKLDNEQDKVILLNLIEKSTIQGSMIFVLADLVQRIQQAEVLNKQEDKTSE